MGERKAIKILVVEDDGITAEALNQALTDMGYRVVGIATSGWEAVDKTIRTKPDLILMDIKLKGLMDGVLATQRIQSQFDVPVVYLTAYADNETLKRVHHSKPYGYLVKPYAEEELRDAVTKALHQHRMEKEQGQGDGKP
jgi:CheY-like chemotaxis protein